MYLHLHFIYNNISTTTFKSEGSAIMTEVKTIEHYNIVGFR